jgi:hypothetical protein
MKKFAVVYSNLHRVGLGLPGTSTSDRNIREIILIVFPGT